MRFYSHSSTVYQAIGLMSGTSLDGIDAACIEIHGTWPDVQVRMVDFLTVPYAPALRERIGKLCEGGSVAEVTLLNVELGEAFARAALEVLSSCGLEAQQIDVIGSHGQTVSHQPEQGATLQIGEPSIIAERTGITTVADFRPRDMAAGGQGAPLAPFLDWLLLRHPTRHRIAQNIGGIANLAWLPASGSLDEMRAWDTGPGNMIIDECVRLFTQGEKYFDENGSLAAQGHVDEEWLQQLLEHPFLQRSTPKSCGREEFGIAFSHEFYSAGVARGLAPHDIIATATALTAHSIAQAYEVFWQETQRDNCDVLVSGGGAYNPTLYAMLQDLVQPAKVLRLEEIGLRSDAKEAIAFALLGHTTMLGVPNNVPGATGATRPVVMGKIVPGRG
jgi:anhydro-N-acetylmuramic acid kinase